MNRREIRRPATRAGLTLVELLIVVAILALLVGVAVPTVQRVRASAANAECQNHLMTVSHACLAFLDKEGYFPRNTVRPRGVTPVDGQPPGNLNRWDRGSYESWPRQIASYLGHGSALTQDALPVLGCPADPRGATYSIPTYGFSWYDGVFSRRGYENDGIIVDDSTLNRKFVVTKDSVSDGLSNTILLAERPPSADGEKGWWDSPWAGDVIAPTVGDRSIVSSSEFGNCPNVATYRQANYRDNCSFNSVWSNHAGGGNVAFGDGSVRVLMYNAATQVIGSQQLIETLASRNRGEIVTTNW